VLSTGSSAWLRLWFFGPSGKPIWGFTSATQRGRPILTFSEGGGADIQRRDSVVQQSRTPDVQGGWPSLSPIKVGAPSFSRSWREGGCLHPVAVSCSSAQCHNVTIVHTCAVDPPAPCQRRKERGTRETRVGLRTLRSSAQVWFWRRRRLSLHRARCKLRLLPHMQ
jgi:hypothetical protein